MQQQHQQRQERWRLPPQHFANNKDAAALLKQVSSYKVTQ
jgi:hypothetical protein